jgi:predicted ester cyclase
VSVDANKAVIRRYFGEVINQGRLDVVGELFQSAGGNAAGAMRAAAALRDAFPDLRATVDDLVGEGDRVVVKVTFEGTQTRPFMGLPASGRQVVFEGVELAHFDPEGRIIGELWHVVDTGAVYRQLGVTGAP